MTREQMLIDLQADGVKMIRSWLASLDDHEIRFLLRHTGDEARENLDNDGCSHERFKLACTCVMLETELVTRMKERAAKPA